jgi:hypothetical protein
MNTSSSWDAVLAAPAACDHLVQLYTDDRSLSDVVARFIDHGLADGDGIVVITTPAHWTAIAAGLTARGIDVAAARARDALLVLDAADTLTALLVDGMPDREAMHANVRPALARVRRAGHTRVRAFGEMVDILNRRGELAAAIALEELWNELLAAEHIALLCAYAVDAFDSREYRATLPGIGAVHSHLMPVENEADFERAIDHAFIDVFGIYGDTRLLRELFIRQLGDGAAMPDAQAALFAIRQIDPRLADAVLERAAAHYRAGA